VHCAGAPHKRKRGTQDAKSRLDSLRSSRPASNLFIVPRNLARPPSSMLAFCRYRPGYRFCCLLAQPLASQSGTWRMGWDDSRHLHQSTLGPMTKSLARLRFWQSISITQNVAQGIVRGIVLYQSPTSSSGPMLRTGTGNEFQHVPSCLTIDSGFASTSSVLYDVTLALATQTRAALGPYFIS
jgi:hypothetical protein